jgi:hypothetical protein
LEPAHLFFGTLITALVLAGCATKGAATGGSGMPAAPEAVRLAADLGGASKAALDGGTVRLLGVADLTTSLTVPAGIMLDLSADGAKLILKDGAKLTVDGTVDARGHGDHGGGWVEGGLCLDEGTAVINGSGTIRLRSKGSLLNIGGGKRHLTLDGVTLAGIEGNDNSLVQVGEGAELVMKSGVITGNTRLGKDWTSGGGVAVGERAVFTMTGGAITGNSITGNEWVIGGGVAVGEGAVFTMTGGTVSGNSITGNEWVNGGGVSVSGGTFAMHGNAAVTGNTASGSGNVFGGGVRMSGGTFTMHGNAAVTGNTATTSGSGNSLGGGVQIEDCTFTMNDNAAVTGNTAIATGTGSAIGGGVRMFKDTFTMHGNATVAGNTAIATGTGGATGGGVRMEDDSTFILSGGTVYGDNAHLPTGANASLANIVTSSRSTASGAAAHKNPRATAKYGDGTDIAFGEDRGMAASRTLNR